MLVVLGLLFSFTPARAQAKRVVVIKVDGLSQDQIDRFVHERDERTGRSLLPWFEHVFYERGTRLQNFYVRGMSLSGPSWSMLDTGQHLQVKGNVEFDRLTLHSYDYLNFIPFWLGSAGRVRVDMPGVELMDELGIPLLVDNYPYDERHVSFQLYQRGTRWTTLDRGLRNYFSRAPHDLFDEWVMGLEGRDIVMGQLEREVIAKLNDPRVRYLDYYTTEFDHAAHHNRDRATHLAALQDLDATIGRVWTAIQKTPQADTTALVVVSDHGTNTDEHIYSQGYNLVHLLSSAEGGGHHVVTKRRLMNDYAVKGFYPLVPLIYTTSDDSYYLKGQSNDYPTALVDFDGNERAAIHLRDSDLNVLQILLQQLQSQKLTRDQTRAARDAFFATIDRRRNGWQKLCDELTEELGALQHLIEKQQAIYEAQPKKWTKADADAGRDQAARRLFAQIDSWTTDARQYTEYLRTLSNLLALRRESFDPSKLKITDLIAKGAMGESNTIRALQDYVAGLSPTGLVVGADGSLDFARSFARINYLQLLRETKVRNNVQPGLDSRPVDFVSLRIPVEDLSSDAAEDLRADTAVWLYRSSDEQALVLARERGGELSLRYLPISNLMQGADGRVRFERAQLRDGLPLKIWEDQKLQLPTGPSRAAWLSAWHTELEWLHALHLTDYSNGLIGLSEQFARHTTPMTDTDASGLSRDEQLIRRYRRRQRLLVETDLLLFANNHWNFDVRGFNPGGNHGSFFRISTHSTLMFTGGDATGIPRGRIVEEPYDSLSFAPTFLALTGQFARPDDPLRANFTRRAREFPGRVITEVLGCPAQHAPAVVDSSAAKNSSGGKH
ncbi:MAG: Type phosphodiesterase / nucleotide pyrophosphatase [Acidobacteriota bacterium]|nr:Type phosphodiesterase / nucleotide pyrophosphatase [Acidobacteriota bacterium]